MILAAGGMLFSNFFGRSASMIENAYGIFTSIKDGKYGEFKNLSQGIIGGADDNLIGCLSELAVDCATMAIPMPLQIGLNLFRGATELVLGKDSMDACVYLAQGATGGDFKGFASKVMQEGKEAKEVWKQCKGASTGVLPHIGERVGHYSGTFYKQISPYLDMLFGAGKKTFKLALAAT